MNALMQGSDDDYEKGELIARKIFGPILRSQAARPVLLKSDWKNVFSLASIKQSVRRITG